MTEEDFSALNIIAGEWRGAMEMWWRWHHWLRARSTNTETNKRTRYPTYGLATTYFWFSGPYSIPHGENCTKVTRKSILTRESIIYAWLFDNTSDQHHDLIAHDVRRVTAHGSHVAITTVTHITTWRVGSEPHTLHISNSEGTFFYHDAPFVVSSLEAESPHSLTVTIAEYSGSKLLNNAVHYTCTAIEFDIRPINDSGIYFSVGWLVSDDNCCNSVHILLVYNAATKQFSERHFSKALGCSSKISLDGIHVWDSSMYRVIFKSFLIGEATMCHCPIQVARQVDDTQNHGEISEWQFKTASLDHKTWAEDYSSRKICGDSKFLVLFAEQGYLVSSKERCLPTRNQLPLEYLAYEVLN